MFPSAVLIQVKGAHFAAFGPEPVTEVGATGFGDRRPAGQAAAHDVAAGASHHTPA